MGYIYNHFNSSVWPLKLNMFKTKLLIFSSKPVPSPVFLSPVNGTTIQPDVQTKNPCIILDFSPSTSPLNPVWVVLAPPTNYILDCPYLPNSAEIRISSYLIKAKYSEYFHLTWKLINYCPLASLLETKIKCSHHIMYTYIKTSHCTTYTFFGQK